MGLYLIIIKKKELYKELSLTGEGTSYVFKKHSTEGPKGDIPVKKC